MNSKKIETQVNEILTQQKITKAPIPVEKVAIKLDLSVVPTDLGPGISGALIIKDGVATIGVNKTESSVRRRFTIAHELGHFFLHKATSDLFVEKMVFLRDRDSATGVEKREREANAFAASLLMPKEILKEELEKALKTDSITNDEELIRHLSKKFEVSEIAMTYRLINLNLWH